MAVARRRSRFTWRAATLALVLLASVAGLVARLVYVQVLNHEHYRTQAREVHMEKRLVRSARGAILDRNGFPLATSVDVYDLYVDRRAWGQDVIKAQNIAHQLAPLLLQEEEQLLAALLDESQGPIELMAEEVHFETGQQIKDLKLPGVTLAAASKRFYPEGDFGATLLGFLGRDHAGLAGLEADLESVLGGTPGALYFERDGGGRPIAFGQIREEPGKPGSDVRLTVDRYIQRLIEIELDQQVHDHQASGGTIIVMDPMTGAILGMATRPSFKLSQLDLSNPDLNLYRNRAATDLYEPGSVLKTLTAAAALDLGLVTPASTYYDTGLVEKGGYTFHNWDFSANGTTNITQLLQKSLNTGAIWLSELIGPDRLYESFKRFGLGESTHSGIGGESGGLVRTNKDPGWYEADQATNSYGQGIATTPLQVITALSSLVNGGRLMRPYVVEEVSGPNTRRVFEPVLVRQAISEETSRTMVEMMRQVVDGVQGHRAQVRGYDVGGKTGTTLVSIPTGYALDSTLASFVGFAPAHDPAIIMLVRIDTPQDDPLGGVVAAPIFGKLAPKILSYLNVKPTVPLVQSGR
jgi:cell division protein FtsI/penicillin-binding protein 2